MLGKEDIAGSQLSTPAKTRFTAKQAKPSWLGLALLLLILITSPLHCRSPAAPSPIPGN